MGKRKVDKEETCRVVENLRRILSQLRKTEEDFKRDYVGNKDYARQILQAHTNAGRKARRDIVLTIQGWGYRDMKEENLLRDPSALAIKERLCPMFDAQAGQPTGFEDGGYPVGIAADYEYADTRDPNAFWIRVHGDSMVGAGIPDGCRVLVEPSQPVGDGNIVFARLGNEVTIKKLYRDGGKIRLQPMNPSYPPIIIEDPEELKTVRIYRVTQILIKII